MRIKAKVIAPLRKTPGENEEKISKLCQLITEKYGGKASASLFHVTSTLLDEYDYWVEESSLFWSDFDEDEFWENANDFYSFAKEKAKEMGMTCYEITWEKFFR